MPQLLADAADGRPTGPLCASELARPPATSSSSAAGRRGCFLGEGVAPTALQSELLESVLRCPGRGMLLFYDQAGARTWRLACVYEHNLLIHHVYL